MNGKGYITREDRRKSGARKYGENKNSSVGMLDGDQSDVLDAVVMGNKGKDDKEILHILKAKNPGFYDNIPDLELIQAIQSSRMLFG
jgi:hypothetical protein